MTIISLHALNIFSYWAESIVDQTKQTRGNHLPVERELHVLCRFHDFKTVAFAQSVSSGVSAVSICLNDSISGYRIPEDHVVYSTRFQHSAADLDRKIHFMKLLLKRQSRHRWHPRRNGKYYQKRLLSFWEFSIQSLTGLTKGHVLRPFWCIYFAFLRVINGPGHFFRLASQAEKITRYCAKGATLSGLLPGVHDIHSSPWGSRYSLEAWNTSPTLSSLHTSLLKGCYCWRACWGMPECRFLGKSPYIVWHKGFGKPPRLGHWTLIKGARSRYFR